MIVIFMRLKVKPLEPCLFLITLHIINMSILYAYPLMCFIYEPTTMINVIIMSDYVCIACYVSMGIIVLFLDLKN